MDKHFIWEITPTNIPLLKKKCSKCRNSNLYYCSGKFRLNSQKRSIDVWLIYRCVKCDNTCNITILSRTNPELIDNELYQKFCKNDEATAWRYALDSDTISKNNMALDYSNVEYDIVHDNITFADMLRMNDDLIEFKVKTEFNLNLKLTTVIKRCFNISSRQLEKMVNAEIITVVSQSPLLKCKVKDGIMITVHCNKLKTYLEKDRMVEE